MRFIPVAKKDYRFLYNLLAKRPKYWNISHNVMPTYNEHCKFNNAKPYTLDYIIYEDKKRIGRLYVTHKDEVGVYCLSEKYIPRVLDEVLAAANDAHKAIFFNVSPNNELLNNYFRKKGLKVIQYTYKYL